MSDLHPLKYQLEALLFASKEPLPLQVLVEVLKTQTEVEKDTIKAALLELEQDYQERGVILMQTALGYRFQTRIEDADLINKLWQVKPKKASKAMMETLALIAYKQPITRPEIEAVRGVNVSSSILQTLQEKGWIEAKGHREIPGRPTLWHTTPVFLTDFNLKSLKELPELMQVPEK